jgi:uroporphyrinogen III methyltransferase/synthase
MPVVELRDRLLVGITSDGIGHERLTRLAAGRGVALLWRPVTHMRPRQGAARRLVELLASRGFDWVAVTSAAAAPAVSQAWAEIAAARTPPRLAAVGPATAAALRARGLRVDLVGPGTGGRALAQTLLAAGPAAQRVLWPRVARPHRGFPAALRTHGARVVEVAVYQRVTAPGPSAVWLAAAWRSQALAAACFTAPSAVRIVLNRVPPKVRRGLRDTVVASIGPATSRELRRFGVTPVVEGAGRGTAALIDDVVDLLNGRIRVEPRL